MLRVRFLRLLKGPRVRCFIVSVEVSVHFSFSLGFLHFIFKPTDHLNVRMLFKNPIAD